MLSHGLYLLLQQATLESPHQGILWRWLWWAYGWVGLHQNMCGVHIVLWAGESPNIWSHMVLHLYGSGQPYIRATHYTWNKS